MTDNQNSSVNSGVHTNVGMDFQKHCTLYLFLDKYEKLKDERYFIILEHHDDIVFGYLSESDELQSIETFQAKKAPSKWTLGSLIEVIKKISMASQKILDDPHPKTADFHQSNYFATNNTIELKTKSQGKTFSETINEANDTVAYNSIDEELKDKILEGNSSISFKEGDVRLLENLYFKYIDLTRTSKNQLALLVGKFRDVFGDNIVDHKAALDTFLFHLKKIESEFNQSGVALLSDKSKRLESSEINDILNILTVKKLAYDFWREKGDTICESLDISVFDKTTFKLHFLNSFDKLKDLNESEHRKVFTFVNDSTNIFKNHSKDADCIFDLYNNFQVVKSSTLSEVQLKAVISASYIEIRNTL